MGTLYDLAQEYRQNIQPMQARVQELRQQLREEKLSREERRKIKLRIRRLEEWIADDLYTIGIMENYYNKLEDANAENP